MTSNQTPTNLNISHIILEGGAKLDGTREVFLRAHLSLQTRRIARLEEVHEVTEVNLKLLEGLERCHDAHALAVLQVGGWVNGGVVWVRVLQGAPHLVVRDPG